MRYRLLGPVRAGEVVLSAGRDRIVLAMLLLHHDRVVAPDELIDAVWGEDPPATARGQVQTCVSRLRRQLPDGLIRTDPAGYGVALGPDDLDAVVFARLVAEARAATDPQVTRRLLRAGLDLWQGPALAGLDSTVLHQAALVLDEQRATAVEDWVDLLPAEDLLPELATLVREFPLRERLCAQYIRALAGAGRTADALAEYDRIAAALRDEVGIEPGAALVELRGRVQVSGLPRPARNFTGRDREVARLRAAVQDDEAPVIVIDGMAGVGKTALAVHLARLVGDRFPDAHLFIDLQGHSAERPLDAGTTLLVLLRRLGVDADRIPAGTPERLTLWRSRLAGRRILVVFDNAAASAQVDELLPPGPGHLAIVTSRRRLRGLDGVRTESIDVLDLDAGVALLGRIVGARVTADPAAAAAIVRSCGALPLAIRLAGAQLAHRPGWRPSDLLHRLDLAGIFALSYEQLAASEQRMFRLLGVHPDAQFDVASAAALADLPPAEAERVVETFVELHLIEEPEPELYRLHDLMRDYARELARSDPAEVDAAVLRVAIHYSEVAHTFARATQAAGAGREYEPDTRRDLLEAVGDPLAWLEVHRTGLLPVLQAARAAGSPHRAWYLAAVTFRYCYTQGYVSDLVAIQEAGLAAAREYGVTKDIADSLFFLAAGRMLTGRLRDSVDLQHESLRLHLLDGESPNTDRLRVNTAGLLGMLGRLDEAWTMAVAAVDGWWRRGAGSGWLGLTCAAEAAMGRGRYADALLSHRLAWAVGLQTGHPVTPGMSLSGLGEVRLRMGQPRLAAVLMREGMRRKYAVNYRVGVIGDLTRLGVAYREMGDFGTALDYHEQAVQAMEELRELRWECVVCNDYAGTLAAQGATARASSLYRQALKAAEQSEIAYEKGRALAGLAGLTGDRGAAREALAIFTGMGAPERFEIERMLREPAIESKIEA